MRNTGIEYASEERTPTILPEFAELLPPLSDEQLSLLEADILKNGCYAPIIVNEELQVVDGHNCLSICEKHDLPYRMVMFSFEDMLEAKQWALDTQKGRRNLEPWELGKIALKLKPDVEARARAKQSAAGGDKYGEKPLSANSPKAVSDTIDTREELANMVGIGSNTMGRIMQIDEHAPVPVKEALDAGELSVNQGYNITRQIKDLPEDEQGEAAERAIELEKAKKELRKSNAEIDHKTSIAKLFCTAFEKALLVEPTAKNVRAYVECTRMTPEEMQDVVKESREIADAFEQIAEIIETTILPEDWRCNADEEADEPDDPEAENTD